MGENESQRRVIKHEDSEQDIAPRANAAYREKTLYYFILSSLV